jgi:Right handed beta helix region
MNGSDSNPGTLHQPLLTINKALSTLEPGDTLYLRSGLYKEVIDPKTAMITIQAFDGELVTIEPPAGKAALNIEGIHHTIWRDLVLDAVHTQFGVRLTDGAHHNRFENLEVKNARRSGIVASEGTGNTDYNEFINCKSHNNGSGVLDHGIDLATSDNLVEGGEYYRNLGFGIHLYNDSPTVHRNVIHRTSAYDNGMFGIMITSGDGNVAQGNIVWLNAHGGIEINWGVGSTNTTVSNNTIFDNGGESIAIGSNNTNVKVINNIVYMNLEGIVNYDEPRKSAR